MVDLGVRELGSFWQPQASFLNDIRELLIGNS